MYDTSMSGYALAPHPTDAYGADGARAALGTGLVAGTLIGAVVIGLAGMGLGGWFGWTLAAAQPPAVQWAAALVGAFVLNPFVWLRGIRRLLS